ncbi:hypothetical protein XENTR_v10020373 [Xenopus tropicalis]|nr:hypothetical protein XENTR_v10020373 [Xenopus tropicalis]
MYPAIIGLAIARKTFSFTIPFTSKCYKVQCSFQGSAASFNLRLFSHHFQEEGTHQISMLNSGNGFIYGKFGNNENCPPNDLSEGQGVEEKAMVSYCGSLEQNLSNMAALYLQCLSDKISFFIQIVIN